LVIFLSVPSQKAGYLNLIHLKNGALYLAGPPPIKNNQEKIRCQLVNGFLIPIQAEKRFHPSFRQPLKNEFKKWPKNSSRGITPVWILDIRFRGQFCYIDAYTEPKTSENWPPPDWPETREEYLERLRNAPVHLCRLRYFGEDRWGFAFFTYSNEKYELSIYPDGQFLGTPEEAFITSANVGLNE